MIKSNCQFSSCLCTLVFFPQLSKDWFPPAEASHKRSIIQKLIYELLDEQRQKIPKVSCNDQCYSDEDDIEKENAVEFLSEQCSPDKKAGLGDLLSSTDGGIERTVLPTSPAVQCVKEAGSVLQDFLEQGAIAGSSSDEGYRPCNLIVSHDSVLLPIEVPSLPLLLLNCFSQFCHNWLSIYLYIYFGN